jgi:hypothetical protein
MSVFRGQHFIDFDEPRPTPSAEAAAKQTPEKKGGDRARVLELLTAAGPLTDEAIAERLGMEANTVRPRRGELVRAGLVQAVDEEGRTRTGSRATRWGVA